jgi:small subunit ribosomal protein S4
MKLFLKGIRCDKASSDGKTPLCSFQRRESVPGMHTSRGKLTDYGLHLREKQKVKHYYGVLERQFRTYFARAARSKGNTGQTLMSLLERRLDNVVHRAGWGASRAQARQMVAHGHILVNGQRVDIPSYLVQPGDVIRVRPKSKIVALVKENVAVNSKPVPDFLTLAAGDTLEATVTRLPTQEDVSITVEPNLIIELCSK